MSEFEEQIRSRLTSNANDFDVIVLDMLKEIERLQTEAERWKRSNDVASQLFNQTRADNERLSAELNAIRIKLCLTFSKCPYLDDGELQDNSCHPAIDYKRETVESILGKIKDKQRKELEMLYACIKELKEYEYTKHD